MTSTGDQTPSASESSEDSPGRRVVFTPTRVVIFVIGIALIAAALRAIVSDSDRLRDAARAVADAPWPLVVLLLVLPVVNWVCTTGTVNILTGRYGRVPFGEMFALIGSAWLFNMLPFRLGLIGRVTFHKKFHGLRVRDCAKVMLQALCCSGVALVVLVTSVWIAGRLGVGRGSIEAGDQALQEWGSLLGIVGVAPLVLIGTVWAALRRVNRAAVDTKANWRWAAAIFVRYVDMLVWFVRYSIVFAMLGHPLPPLNAAAVTVSAQAAMVTPVQFGLREWTVGFTAGVLESPSSEEPHVDDASTPSERTANVFHRATPGLLSDACMRAAELAVVIPAGFLCTLWAMRRISRSGAEPSAGDRTERSRG